MSNHQAEEAEKSGAPTERHTRAEEPSELESRFKPEYVDSWALVVGINDYEDMNKLKYAVNDARAVAELLITQLGFPRENVFVILDPPPGEPDPHYDLAGTDATKAALEEWAITKFPALAGSDDRVLFFFAGHGESRERETGGPKGYLVPADGRPGAWHTFIETDDVIEAGEFCKAKHQFYLFDSCFSGLAVARSGIEPTPFETIMLTNRARMGLTAGTAGQTVADVGPSGHSPFTSYVLQGLHGEAAQKDAHAITGSDLIHYVRNEVAKRYGDVQTPDWGKLPGHGPGGDFLFQLPPAAKPIADISEWVPVHNTTGPEIAAIATAGAMEACLAQRGITVRLDALNLYARAKEHDEIASEGTYLTPVIFVADFFGVQIAADAAGSSSDARYHARFYPVLSLDDIPGQLVAGRPVLTGAMARRSWFAASNGEIPTPVDDDHPIGGLVVTIVRYDPNEEILRFTPHWSETWGDNGFGTMSRKAAEQVLLLDQMWAVEVRG